MHGYPEGAACDLPLDWRLAILEARVRATVTGDLSYSVTSADALPAAEYGALLAEVYSRGDDFPAVLIDGDLVCANGIDPDAVIAALGET